MKKTSIFSVIALLAVLSLAACGDENDSNTMEQKDMDQNEMNMSEENMDHSSMNHSSDGEVPEGLAKAQNPTYPVGTKVILSADHMEGMDGADATISGAFTTIAYAVTYTPTTGGEPVENHKWIIHEEIKNAGDTLFKTGDEVTLNADHMEGMNGAQATIDSANETTVYVVDYTDTKTGQEVKNHKWVTEDEIQPAK